MRMCPYYTYGERLLLTGRSCSVALVVQIHLQQNRTDLALKEAQRARKWAQDSLLVNLAESWVGMREVRIYRAILSSLQSNTKSLGR